MPIISVKDLYKSFRPEVTWRDRLLKKRKDAVSATEVIKGIDLSVDKSEVVAIIGPSGSGKTTLLRCLNFLEKADAGTLTFDGEDFDLSRIRRRDINRLRKKTGFVFQSYNLFFNRTALGNVTEGLIAARDISKADAHRLGHQRPGSGADRRSAPGNAGPGSGGYDHAGGHPRDELRPQRG